MPVPPVESRVASVTRVGFLVPLFVKTMALFSLRFEKSTGAFAWGRSSAVFVGYRFLGDDAGLGETFLELPRWEKVSEGLSMSRDEGSLVALGTGVCFGRLDRV